eukprot:gnl/MRDRNA2_/MRDRNA2_111418_c0_seq1.p1 gnl/MRDRNA2_/MRDRNA2_111418_c0~~gnl/MRDRNA2_/MRDRNA2_111418_c0_seq1.p1  ORF type:complete len:622 (+),score=111.43 gnl/MRDRNA2_/MRDRNA2_111418_c0_seq1:130-1995(+)
MHSPMDPHMSSMKTDKSLEGITKTTEVARAVIKSPAFEKAVLFLIVTNAAWIGVDVDWNEGPEGALAPMVFTIVESAFCCLFTLEIILRMLTYTSKIRFFKDPAHWKSNVFDLFLVLLMILEAWILQAFSSGTNLHQFSLIRLLRLMRLLRITRIISIVPELGMMVKSLKDAARSVTSTLILEIGIMYIVGVIFTQWAKEHANPCFPEMDEGACFLHEYFGSIAKSLVTLLQILVFDNTFIIIRPILSDSWYMGCLLILFMVVGSWTVLNMLIGIICEIICTGTAEEKMKILEHRVMEVFSCIDLDGSGTVSRDEFNRHGVQQQLIKLGISGDIVRNAFDILDCDDSGYFESKDFMSMVFKLLNPPQSQDIQVLNQKLSEIAAQMNIQAFAAHSSKRLAVPSLSGASSHVAPCEEVIVCPQSGNSKSSTAVDHDLRTLASQYSSDSNAEFQNQTCFASAQVKGGHEVDCDMKAHASAPAQNTQACQDIGTDGYHPFAPQDDSTDSDVFVADTPPDQVMEISVSQRKAQSQEIYERLQQLVDSAEKVEEALELVHGRILWESSDVVKIDFGDKEAKGLGGQYTSLQNRNQLRGQSAVVFSPKNQLSLPLRMMLQAYTSRNDR